MKTATKLLEKLIDSLDITQVVQADKLIMREEMKE